MNRISFIGFGILLLSLLPGYIILRIHRFRSKISDLEEQLQNKQELLGKIRAQLVESEKLADHHKGTGLGLSIVCDIIKQKLAGNIICQSEFGDGVLFNIEVPVTY